MSNNMHVAINLQLCALPVKHIPSWSSYPSIQALDEAIWEYRVPHINVVDLTNQALFGIKVTNVTVWILSKDHFAPWPDGVTLLVNFGQAFLPIHEDICCSRAGIPGETQVALQGAKLRNLEEHSISTQVESQSTATDLEKVIRLFDKMNTVSFLA